MIRRLESRRFHLLGGRRDLLGLEIRDLSFRPQRNPLSGDGQNGEHQPRTQTYRLFHRIAPVIFSVSAAAL